MTQSVRDVRQRELFDDNPGPCDPPRKDDVENRCEWGDCDHEAVTFRPGFNRPLKVCDDHRSVDPRPEAGR